LSHLSRLGDARDVRLIAKRAPKATGCIRTSLWLPTPRVSTSTPPPHPLEPHLRHHLTAFGGSGERRTWWVVAIATAMMIAEITGGWVFGSMALFADGWHMGSHTAALGITLYAYRFARRHAQDPRFSFGTGKVSSLGGFASGVALGVVAILMGWESAERVLRPEEIQFDEAIAVAAVGLGVNLLSAWLLGHGHAHGHAHAHGHEDAHAHEDEDAHNWMVEDHNLRAAYLHVLADALTSILAIFALIAGRVWGGRWLDPLMGLVGAGVILHWTVGLLRQSGRILLDCDPAPELSARVRAALEGDPADRVTDFHLWALAPGHYAAVARIETSSGRTADDYRWRMPRLAALRYALLEISAPARAAAVPLGVPPAAELADPQPASVASREV
jgi:cation diffusion facilitator family transporter